MFYDNLKSLCDSKGLKISNVVTDCGGALGSISGWKKGVMPNSSIVITLATRFNVSTDYLLLGKEDVTSNNECSQASDEIHTGNINNNVIGDNNSVSGNSITFSTDNNDTNGIYSELINHLESLPSSKRRHALADLMDILEENYPL